MIEVGTFYAISTKELSGTFCVIGVNQAVGAVGLLKVNHQLRKIGEQKYHVPKIAAVTPLSVSIGDFTELSEKEIKRFEPSLPPITKKFPSVFQVKDHRNISRESEAARLKAQYKAKNLEKRYLRSCEILAILGNSARALKAIARGDWGEYIREGANACGLSMREARRHLSRLASCGWNQRAASMFYANGAANVRTGDCKAAAGVFLGRKPYEASDDETCLAPRVRWSPSITLLVRATLGAIKNRKAVTVAAMYRKYQSYNKVVSHLADGTVVAKANLELNITYSQFYYCKSKLESKIITDKKFFGEIKYLNNKQPLVGTARHQILYPGQCYIIDSTMVDMEAVCSFDRRRLAGRPYLYVVIDAFSSLIVGLHLTFEPPSVAEARIALFRAVAPRHEHFKHLGIEWLYPYFPQGVLPEEIFADRGELLSRRGLEMAEIANVSMSYAAPYRAAWKSLVERVFKMFNDKFFKWSPGGKTGPRERGDKVNELDAILTINEIFRCLYIEAARLNFTRDMSAHAAAPLIRDRIPCSPLGFWAYGLEHFHGGPAILTREDAAMSFLPSKPASIRKNGYLTLAKEGEPSYRFTQDWIRNSDEFYALNGTSGFIKIDPDLPGHALVQLPKSGDIRQVSMVACLEKFKYEESDLSVDEIRIFETLASQKGRESSRKIPTLDQCATFDANIEEITDAATSATARAVEEEKLPKSERFNKTNNRKQEKKLANSENSTEPSASKSSSNEAGEGSIAAPLGQGGRSQEYEKFLKTICGPDQ